MGKKTTGQRIAADYDHEGGVGKEAQARMKRLAKRIDDAIKKAARDARNNLFLSLFNLQPPTGAGRDCHGQTNINVGKVKPAKKGKR